MLEPQRKKSRMKKIAVLDTETSGVGQGHGVCDLAIVFVDEDFNELDSYESLVDPECKISPSAMGIHHITDKMVEFEPTLAEAMDAWHFPLAGVDVVVGHNVRFDIGFLKPYIPVDALIIDTLKLSRQAWVEEVENHKLQTLRYHFNLEGGEAHRAMGDVKATISLCKLLCEHHNTDANGLLAMMSAALPLTTKMPFGKHKDAMLKDLPLNYVQWLLEKADNLDEDLRATLLTRLK